MNAADISLKDLAYILAVAELSSFSKAAEHCAVSQPALSKQIMSVEKAMGIKLFERNKRSVLLTPLGGRFVEQARLVMDEAQKLVEIAQSRQGVLTGTLRLGVIASSCPYLLPHFIGDLKTTYPKLKFVVKEGLTDSLIHDLKQGKLDGVIAATTFHEDLLEHLPLFFEPFLLASAKSAPSPGKPKVSVSDIDPEHLLLLEDGHCLKDQTLDLCALTDSQTHVNFKATSLETLLHMTAGGLGVSIIPVLAEPRQSKLHDELQFHPFKEQNNGRIMALYYRKSYPHIADMQALAEFIKTHLPERVEPL